jgi:hypothetical protein
MALPPVTRIKAAKRRDSDQHEDNAMGPGTCAPEVPRLPGWLRPTAPALHDQGQSAFPDLVGKIGDRSFANAESSLGVHIGLRVKSPA